MFGLKTNHLATLIPRTSSEGICIIPRQLVFSDQPEENEERRKNEL
jgi:hypothetical protein